MALPILGSKKERLGEIETTQTMEFFQIHPVPESQRGVLMVVERVIWSHSTETTLLIRGSFRYQVVTIE